MAVEIGTFELGRGGCAELVLRWLSELVARGKVGVPEFGRCGAVSPKGCSGCCGLECGAELGLCGAGLVAYSGCEAIMPVMAERRTRGAVCRMSWRGLDTSPGRRSDEEGTRSAWRG